MPGPLVRPAETTPVGCRGSTTFPGRPRPGLRGVRGGLTAGRAAGWRDRGLSPHHLRAEPHAERPERTRSRFGVSTGPQRARDKGKAATGTWKAAPQSPLRAPLPHVHPEGQSEGAGRGPKERQGREGKWGRF